MSLLAIPSGSSSNVSGGFYPYAIDGSLRFEDGGSAYLTRTNATADDDDVWTWSAWVKRGNLGITTALFSAGSYPSPYETIYFTSGDIVEWRNDGGGVGHGVVQTTGVLRDPSAWYHIVVARNVGTVTIYVNGEDRSTTVASITASTRTLNDSGALQRLGASERNRYPFDGYMAEVNFVDGQALTASSFGETLSGVWVPKAYSGSYGTNGFYLDLVSSNWSNPNVLDSSGNSNNWAASGGIDSHDFVLDSPTNNSATWNVVNTSGTLSQGNLQASITDNRGTLATFSMPEGKWYWEVMYKSGNSHISIASDATPVLTQSINSTSTKSGTYYYDGRYYKNGVQQGTAASLGTDDILAMTYDSSTRQWTTYKNNSSTSQFTLTLDALTDSYAPALGSGGTPSVIGNFGQDSTFAGSTTAGGNTDENGYGDFKYAVPSGFLALCTANLTVAEGVDPAEGNSPQDHFNTVLWTGDGTSPRNITTVGFEPSLVWWKTRNQSYDHRLYDQVRGTGKRLGSNSTAAETTTTELTAFNSDGFTLGNGAASAGNGSGETMVAWNWKANGAGSANSEGSITTTSTSANTTSGFSIIKWTGDGTIGHGLDETPEMFIVKDLTAASSWWVWHKDYDNTSAGYMQLNDSGNAERSNTSVWRNAYPATATTIDVNTAYLNYSTDNYLALCFHSVDGFSKFGSYIGNGGGGGTSGFDGPFVYTGFRPSFVLVRNIDNGWNWIIWDSKRDTYNQVNGVLQPNNSNVEYDVGGYMSVDFLSNGFKIRSDDAQENGNGNKHIYMAFAENPFKYANAR